MFQVYLAAQGLLAIPSDCATIRFHSSNWYLQHIIFHTNHIQLSSFPSFTDKLYPPIHPSKGSTIKGTAHCQYSQVLNKNQYDPRAQPNTGANYIKYNSSSQFSRRLIIGSGPMTIAIFCLRLFCYLELILTQAGPCFWMQLVSGKWGWLPQGKSLNASNCFLPLFGHVNHLKNRPGQAFPGNTQQLPWEVWAPAGGLPTEQWGYLAPFFWAASEALWLLSH